MKRIYTKIQYLYYLVIFFFPLILLGAQHGSNTNPGGGGTNTNPNGIITLQNPLNGSGDLAAFIQTVINDIVLPVGGVVVVIFVIYSGFKFVIARGNEQKLAEAKRNLLWVFIGTAVLLGSWVISQAIGSTINSITN